MHSLLAAPIVALAAFVASTQTPPAQAPASAAAVRAEPAVIDFGFVKPEETVTAKVMLINPLDQPVTIARAVPSCQCTGIDIEGKTIPAKGTLEMPISMKMSKAPVRKGASVTLVLQPVNQVLKVEMSAEVTLPIRATPNFVDAQKGALTGEFTISASDGKPFRVLTANGVAPIFRDFDPAKDAPKSSYRIGFDFSAPGFAVPKYFVVETDRPDCPLVDLRVRHETTRISPPVKVAEFRSSIGRVAPGAPGSFDLEFEAVGAARVASVRSLWEGASVRLVEQRPDGQNLLIVCEVLPKPGHVGPMLFPIEIAIGNATYRHLVMGTVRPEATANSAADARNR